MCLSRAEFIVWNSFSLVVLSMLVCMSEAVCVDCARACACCEGARALGSILKGEELTRAMEQQPLPYKELKHFEEVLKDLLWYPTGWPYFGIGQGNSLSFADLRGRARASEKFGKLTLIILEKVVAADSGRCFTQSTHTCPMTGRQEYHLSANLESSWRP